jgi:lysophospholipase L1-like esterase
MTRYLALGDSISIDDYTGQAGGGAASQFARLIGATETELLAADGCTSTQALDLLESLTFSPDVTTLTIGGNDLLQAAFLTPPEGDRWSALVTRPVERIEQIAQKLRQISPVVIINTIYDPTGRAEHTVQSDADFELATALKALNAGIRAIARRHGFLLADLYSLFRGHDSESTDPWIVYEIEPNLAGATAIAAHWADLYRAR